ncbi:MAG: ABC transporter ATP-binding protein, partial [Solirubrobacteraceae bacterium]
FHEVGEAYRRRNQETVVQNALYFPFVDLLSSLATAIILGYGGYLVFDGQTSYGVLVAFLGYSTSFFDPVQQLSQLYSTFLSAVAALDKIMEVLVEDPDVTDPEDAVELAQIAGDVRFDDVHFSYATGPEVLHGIDLDVPAGQVIALVGAMGSGKSALVSLLPRLYDVNAGSVSIDGADVRSVTLDSLRAAIAIVTDDPFLFSATVHENIAYARAEATREEVIAAAQAAQAHEFISRLPDGYDTRVGERGLTLSGGQRQRIAIARAVLADPRVLILDDATSSVDASTESDIKRALADVLAGRTTFVIAHRLSTIALADRIVVLEGGRLVDDGTHDELLQRSDLYREIVEKGMPDQVFLNRKPLEPEVAGL